MKGPATMRRADEFDALVTDRATSSADGRYADLLTLVAELRAVPEVAPRTDFVTDLRSQLVAAAQRQAAGSVDRATALRLTPQQRRGVGERRLAAAIGGFAAVAATGSMAMASQGALPGDVLYPVKRAIENAQTNLSADDATRAAELRDHAQARLSEVEALTVRSGDAAAITQALEDFTAQANQAAGVAIADFDATGDPDSISDLRTFSDDALARLDRLSGDVPSESRPALLSAAKTLEQISAATYESCASCVAPPLTSLAIFDTRSLSTALTPEDGLELTDLPEITAADLAAGERTVEELERAREKAQNGTTEDVTDTDAGDKSTLPTGPIPEVPVDANEDPVTKTVKDLTKALGLTPEEAEEADQGLLGTLVEGLLGDGS